MIGESLVKDPSLAPEGHRKIDWVAQHAPVLNKIAGEQLADGSLRGRKVAMTIHLEAKTAYLALLLSEAGAELVGRLIEHHPDLVGNVLGASEETTTGVLKLRAMTAEDVLPFPVLAVNDAKMKHLFDNRYGTGHSSIVALLSNTNLFLSGKAVVVMGFGWVGRGLAKYADGMGARVIVCEPDPVKLLEAYSEGYEVMNSLQAAEVGDVFLTGTGNLKVLRIEHFGRMKDGALLANAGHYDHEFDLAALRQTASGSREVRRNITEYELPDGRRLHVLARGRLVNIAASDGHPVEIMDLTFAVQALAAHHLAT